MPRYECPHCQDAERALKEPKRIYGERSVPFLCDCKPRDLPEQEAMRKAEREAQEYADIAMAAWGNETKFDRDPWDKSYD